MTSDEKQNWSRLDFEDILDLVTRLDIWSSSCSRSRRQSRRTGRRSPDGSRPPWEGWASGRETATC